MPSFFEIPFSPRPERFTVTLSGTDYRLTVQYRKAGGAGWVLDIADASDNPLVSGIPLVTGVDLLAQYKHLGFQGRLWVQGAAIACFLGYRLGSSVSRPPDVGFAMPYSFARISATLLAIFSSVEDSLSLPILESSTYDAVSLSSVLTLLPDSTASFLSAMNCSSDRFTVTTRPRLFGSSFSMSFTLPSPVSSHSGSTSNASARR